MVTLEAAEVAVEVNSKSSSLFLVYQNLIFINVDLKLM